VTELHDLVAPYALDALDGEELVEFESHLETCSSCQLELADLREDVTAMADAIATPPPSRLKDAVFEAIDQTERPGNAPVVLAERRRSSLGWVVASAAAVVALVFFGLWTVTHNQLGEAQRIAAVYEAPDATVVNVSSDQGPARLVWSPSMETGVFNGGSLADVGDNQVYELWLISDDGVSGAGTLDAGDSAVLVEAVQTGQTFAMTIEQAPGVDVSSQPPVFAADL
jgi:Anti-sigma-K factor rskA, C-terminal/Putative zinc-finger